MSQYSDEDIINLIKENNSKGIELLFKKYYKSLCSISNRYIRDENHAEDIVQELVLDIWNKRDKLNINSSLGSYLRRSAVNRSLNHIRSKRVVIVEEDQGMNVTFDNRDVQLQLEKEEMERFINDAIDELPEKCRLVFVMSRFDGLSYKEISEKLEISTKTVENQIYKALKHLKARLKTRKMNNI